MKSAVSFSIALVLLTGCAGGPAFQFGNITPTQAILAAAGRPEGFDGTFEMIVKRVGRQDGTLFLDSETDYRDQRCLVVDLPHILAVQFENQIGGSPETLLEGREIRVTGTARRITIWFYSNGARTDKYYYQTHVFINDVSQITILPKT